MENQKEQGTPGVSRRTFIKLGVGGSAALLVGYGAARQLGSYSAAAEKFAVLSDKEYAIIQALGDAFFPKGAAGAPLSGSEASTAKYLDNHLAELTPDRRRLTRALFHAFEHGTILFGFSFKRFTSLTLEQRQKYLAGWMNSSLYLKRQLFTSAKAAMAAGYFADPKVRDHFGVRSVCE